MNTYVASFEHDEDEGFWNVSVQVGKHESAFSYGRTFTKAAVNIRESLAALLDVDEDSFALEYEIVVGNAVVSADELQELREAREELDAVANRNRDLVSKLAHELVTDFHLSVRDAGAILGLSGARVAQVLNEKTKVA
jgi:ribosome-binding protein aMBF1 (putative translation factor)